MQASENCLALIKRCEGLALLSYMCPAGIWTIGYGHTAGVMPGVTITERTAEALLVEDVRSIEAELRPMAAGVLLVQGQWDALVSLCFNLKGGPRALPKKAPKLWASVLAGDREAAACEFLDINKAGGRELAGLTARRQAEAEMFLQI